ncbi:acetone carboxylase [Quadrisphaera sp. KR29]|uniref:acetone carboxylase n=1 Tax=Quadrisphaera sp. KR29 TaxID=3461391 RepID=UPI004043A3B7
MAPELHEPAPDLVCSARGCRAGAAHALRWNNPRLHTPERRKTWLACDEHREGLSAHLQVRGFLREVEAVSAQAPLQAQRTA